MGSIFTWAKGVTLAHLVRIRQGRQLRSPASYTRAGTTHGHSIQGSRIRQRPELLPRGHFETPDRDGLPSISIGPTQYQFRYSQHPTRSSQHYTEASHYSGICTSPKRMAMQLRATSPSRHLDLLQRQLSFGPVLTLHSWVLVPVSRNRDRRCQGPRHQRQPQLENRFLESSGQQDGHSSYGCGPHTWVFLQHR